MFCIIPQKQCSALVRQIKLKMCWKNKIIVPWSHVIDERLIVRKLQLWWNTPRHRQQQHACTACRTRFRQQHVSLNPINKEGNCYNKIGQRIREKLFTFPQKVHVYFECWVISIFFTILRKEAP